MASPRLLIGISGGHTKSVGLAVSEDFSLLKVVCGPSLNLHTYPYEQVLFRFEELTAILARRLGLQVDEMRDQTSRLVISMPGAGTSDDQDLVNYCLSLAGWKEAGKTLVVDDTWAGLVAGTLSYTGTCAFAGTGASIYVHVDEENNAGQPFGYGKPYKIDGWGPTIGDFGSGFQLVTDMFRMFNRSYDSGKSSELFSAVVRLEPAIKDIRNAQRWFDSIYIVHPTDWRVKFARLAAAVTAAADPPNPDPDAMVLVQGAANAMVESISIALEKFPKAKELPIVCQGGMFEHSRLYLDLVSQAVKKIAGGPFYLSFFRPVVGAIIIALAGPEGLPGLPKVQNLHTRITALAPDERLLLIRTNGKDLFRRD